MRSFEKRSQQTPAPPPPASLRPGSLFSLFPPARGSRRGPPLFDTRGGIFWATRGERVEGRPAGSVGGPGGAEQRPRAGRSGLGVRGGNPTGGEARGGLPPPEADSPSGKYLGRAAKKAAPREGGGIFGGIFGGNLRFPSPPADLERGGVLAFLRGDRPFSGLFFRPFFFRRGGKKKA